MDRTSRMARLPKDADLLEALAALCREAGVDRGALQVIGSLREASLGCYRQAERRYVTFAVPDPTEIVSGQGNVSLKDGRPFVHLHLVLAREDGGCVGGHAMPGCRIFAAEAALLGLEGEPLVREPDQETGLALWREDPV